MTQAGKYRDVIVIQAPVETLNSLGEEEPNYQNLYTDVRAEVVPLSGREYVSAKQISADITTRIEIRYVPNITPKCRILREVEYGNPAAGIEVYDILAVLPDPHSGKRYINMMCVQRFSEGWRRGNV